MFAAHFPVKELHPVLFAPAGPGGEFLAGGEKAAVFAQGQAAAIGCQQRAGTIEFIDHVLLTPLGGDDLGGVEFGRGGGDPLGVAGGVPVGHAVAGGLEGGGEVLHGRQQQDELLPVPRQGGTLGDRFQQQHDDVVAGFAGDVRDGARGFPGGDEGEGSWHCWGANGREEEGGSRFTSPYPPLYANRPERTVVSVPLRTMRLSRRLAGT